MGFRINGKIATNLKGCTVSGFSKDAKSFGKQGKGTQAKGKEARKAYGVNGNSKRDAST